MTKGANGRQRSIRILAVGALIALGILAPALYWFPVIRLHLEQSWIILVSETKRILGLEKGGVPPEERQVREQVILKKMEEAGNQLDWRPVAPEYPRANPLGPFSDKEKMKAFKNSPEFREMDHEVKEYLRKKEDLFELEVPLPPPMGGVDATRLRDGAVEKAMERLTASKGKGQIEKPLEENLKLGIRGPVASRKILERPQPPSVKVRMEAEIELTFWVLPDGVVDRVVPSMKGDVELERIAIQYLRQWRFAPLPTDRPPVEQWGTIPIKFRLH